MLAVYLNRLTSFLKGLLDINERQLRALMSIMLVLAALTGVVLLGSATILVMGAESNANLSIPALIQIFVLIVLLFQPTIMYETASQHYLSRQLQSKAPFSTKKLIYLFLGAIAVITSVVLAYLGGFPDVYVSTKTIIFIVGYPLFVISAYFGIKKIPMLLYEKSVIGAQKLYSTSAILAWSAMIITIYLFYSGRVLNSMYFLLLSR